VYFISICHILWLFWYIFPVLVSCSKKNLANLHVCVAILVAEQQKTFEGGADNGKETFEEKRSCTYGAASKARVTRLGEFSPDG
jgi:hypothetical protein